MDVGGKQREIGVVAAVERQIHHGPGADDLAVFARIGVNQARTHDRHGFAGGTYLEFSVHAAALVDVHVDIGCRKLREAVLLDGESVTTDFDVKEIVVATGIRLRFCFCGRVLVGQSDGGTRYRTLRGIVNVPRTSAVSNCPKSDAAGSSTAAKAKKMRKKNRFIGGLNTTMLAGECFVGLTRRLRRGQSQMTIR